MAAVRKGRALGAGRRVVVEQAAHKELVAHRTAMGLHRAMEQDADRTAAVEDVGHRLLQEEGHHKVAVGLESHTDELEAAEEGNLLGAAAEDNMEPGLPEGDIVQREGLVVRSSPD
jgi:hypothetical protein